MSQWLEPYTLNNDEMQVQNVKEKMYKRTVNVNVNPCKTIIKNHAN